MRITAIRRPRRSSHRFSIFLDGTYAFSLSEETILLHSLSVGTELDEAQTAQILAEDEGKQAKESAGGSVEVLAAQKEVDRLEKVIGDRESELKAKEAFLAQKERELQIKEQAVISDNLETAAKEREAEMQAQKAKTGTDRLDDLLFGGLPMGSNVLITGPPFTARLHIVCA